MYTTIYSKEWEIDTGTEGRTVYFEVLSGGDWRVHETNYGAVSERVYGSWDNERWVDVPVTATERLLPLLFAKLWNGDSLDYDGFKAFLEENEVAVNEGHWM